MKSEIIYLDHNATTPVDPRVLDAMLPYFTEVYGNAASNDHEFGLVAKRAVDEAREKIAAAINAKPQEIIFTSGATESDNIALLGVAEKYREHGNHIITSVTEHKAVLDCCERLEYLGFEVTKLPVDGEGRLDLAQLEAAITNRTVLVSIMAANNEIGTLAQLKEIGSLTRRKNVLFHTDAAQAVGHIPIDVQSMNIDIMSLSAHKTYGPKGIGALFRRQSNPYVKLEPVIYGGRHEKGIRSGTLNVPGIVGFGEAIRLATKEMKNSSQRYREWTTKLLLGLQNEITGVVINGPEIGNERLPHNLNVSIADVESRALIVRLKTVAIATGSACTSALVEPSHVIRALGFGDERAHTAIRLSVGRFNSDKQIEQAVARIVESALEVRSLGKLE